MDENSFYRQLVQRYKNNEASDEEITLFFHLLENGKLDAFISEVMDAEVPEIKPVRRMYARWWIAAASILILFGTAAYFTTSRPAKEVIVKNNEIVPGGNKAVLTLANGSSIILEDVENGNLASQGNARVVKTGDILAYNTDHADAGSIMYNSVTTPKGGQYRIVLSDGSHVWLNAASSIRFPTTFPNNERVVELTGEGYFEIEKNAAAPFKVKLEDGAEVEVLGTHFNIMAYKDEAENRTTLLEGSVRVSKNGANELLKPGDQAVLTGTGAILLKKGVDVAEATAWKNGLFLFRSADIKTLMRQAARWYDIEIIYEGGITTDRFSGKISRNSSLQQFLKILQLSDVNYKIQDRKLIITP